MRKMLVVLLVCVSLVSIMATVAHAEGRPMISPTNFGSTQK